jgi:hypothetical protein
LARLPAQLGGQLGACDQARKTSSIFKDCNRVAGDLLNLKVLLATQVKGIRVRNSELFQQD